MKTSDSSIPRLLMPLAEAKPADLVKQLQPYADLQSLKSWSVYIRFTDAEAAERYREAEAILVLMRPDKIHMVIQAPVVKTKVAEMVSEANKFKVAVYPSDYKRFLIGRNDADYSNWRATLGEKGKSALISARPFHFTEALMMRPLDCNDPQIVCGMEEVIVEEPDMQKGAKKGARALRSFYVIQELERPSPDSGTPVGRVRRRFWFDRTQNAQFARQQIFDNQGELITEVIYSDYKKLNGSSKSLWPGVVVVNRPHDGYSARLTFSEDRFEVNPQLPPNAFTLDNTEGLPETDLDKPITP
ncbi:MAG: hypothetical protein J2P41_14415 [Blastocatellia bacterium]|nr:hypothetical protein [Blastocatellia bacterium]